MGDEVVIDSLPLTLTRGTGGVGYRVVQICQATAHSAAQGALSGTGRRRDNKKMAGCATGRSIGILV